MRIILVAYIFLSRLEVQAGFATVGGLGRCPGRLCHGVSGLGRCPGRLCHGVSGLGRCPGRPCHGVSGLGRCPVGLGIGLVLVLAVAVGRRKHNFTQLNRIKIHNFNYMISVGHRSLSGRAIRLIIWRTEFESEIDLFLFNIKLF